jgi:peptidoglycan-N-acetylglucosamine deacetylase
MGGAAAGSMTLLGGQASYARTTGAGSIQYYGGPESAVHEDHWIPPSAHDGHVIWSAPTTARRIALTFDDGPSPDWTPRVLDTLARHDARATFFCRGDNVERYSRLHQDSVGVHEIGNHSYDHPDMSTMTLDECLAQLRRTTVAIRGALGVEPTLFRPPYGHLGGAAMLAASESGLTTVIWSMQMLESTYEENPRALVDFLAGLVTPGAIILAHDTGSSDRLVAIDRLDRIIRRLRGDGYEFTTVSDLCGLPAR